MSWAVATTSTESMKHEYPAEGAVSEKKEMKGRRPRDMVRWCRRRRDAGSRVRRPLGANVGLHLASSTSTEEGYGRGWRVYQVKKFLRRWRCTPPLVPRLEL